MYWSVTVLGFISLGLAIATTVALVQDGGGWRMALLAAGLYAASVDFLYAAFGPTGHWPIVLWFWP